MAAQESGIVKGLKWLTSSDPCPRCKALNGTVKAIGEPFHVDSGGGPYAVTTAPPLHPHCMCTLIEVIDWDAVNGPPASFPVYQTPEQPKPKPPEARQTVAMPSPVADMANRWVASLTSEEQNTVRAYIGPAYEKINEELRSDPDQMTEQAKRLSVAIAKAGALPTPTMVYRGIALTPKKRQALIDLVERAKTNGQLVQFPGFSSTSIDPNVAAGDEFTTQKKPTVLEIRATHGAPAGSLGRKFEAEILLDHNSTFRVVGVETVKYRQDDGRMIPVTAIQLEQVPTPAKPKVVERLSAGGTAIVKAVKDSVNRFVLDSVEGIALVTP